MSSERHAFHAELIARDDEALWNWPWRSGAARAEELAQICEQLAAILEPDEGAGESAADDGIAADPVARAKLNYIYGSTLLTLAERDEPERLPDAVERLGHALSLARRHVPERVVVIKTQLYRAEHSLAMQQRTASDESRLTEA